MNDRFPYPLPTDAPAKLTFDEMKAMVDERFQTHADRLPTEHTHSEMPTLFMPELPTIELEGNPEREEMLFVMTSLVAADLPGTRPETRHRDRHLWLDGIEMIAKSILKRVDKMYPRGE
jgi:hypothetical protein